MITVVEAGVKSTPALACPPKVNAKVTSSVAIELSDTKNGAVPPSETVVDTADTLAIGRVGSEIVIVAGDVPTVKLGCEVPIVPVMVRMIVSPLSQLIVSFSAVISIGTCDEPMGMTAVVVPKATKSEPGVAVPPTLNVTVVAVVLVSGLANVSCKLNMNWPAVSPTSLILPSVTVRLT